MTLIRDLGCKTNLEVINQLIDLTGRYVIDAGCGGMDFTRHLTDLGARVLAIDPDPVQAELNRTAAPLPLSEFVETGAEKLPVPDQSVDGVFFSYSLHHIPKVIYRVIFDEVFRVLRPDGFLFVIEPTACPLNDVMKLFQNEDRERADAQQALEEIAIPAFNGVNIVTYHSLIQYESFEHFVEQFATRSYDTSYTEADVRQAKVKEAFEHYGGPDHRFKSKKQVIFLKGFKETT